MPAATVRTLLTGLIDYAGLFPPAALPMGDIAENYSTYRASADAWALGRLVIPVARLDELSAELNRLNVSGSTWRISALVGDDCVRDAAAIDGWNARESGRAVVDTVEVKAASPTQVDDALAALGDGRASYVEIPIADDPREMIAAIRAGGARAKVRTGGVVSTAFPRVESVARFLAACAKANVPFKATAGLHHPLCGKYRLTYEPNAQTGAMFGFLNIFVAAAFARFGMGEPELVTLLEEDRVSAFEFSDVGLVWRDHSLALNQIADTRGAFATSFGSCSFREPVTDLDQLGLL